MLPLTGLKSKDKEKKKRTEVPPVGGHLVGGVDEDFRLGALVPLCFALWFAQDGVPDQARHRTND